MEKLAKKKTNRTIPLYNKVLEMRVEYSNNTQKFMQYYDDGYYCYIL